MHRYWMNDFYDFMDPNSPMGGWGGWFIVYDLVKLLIIIAAIIIIVRLLTNSFHKTDQGKHNKAIDILKERYARGEIDEEEYREKMEKLNK
ncbi:SHOCT domain-containing protein [Jeotgalibaca ciconiae]|jgi:Predicted membrane protein|nr:SHOCT domain-containing protein [Jeotgalibaca ciconiae]HLR89193.1 SHOCT domain-containing protein [Atopostipes sp.]